MTAQQLKNSILQMAVQGKLVPQDPNDEPASVLLERIRKEKEALVKAGKSKKDKNPSVIFRGADNTPYEKVGNSEPVSIAEEIPFEIPDSWGWSRIKNVFFLQAGKNIKSENIKEDNYDNSFPCFGGNGIRGYVSEYNHEGDYPIIGRQGALCGNINRANGKFYATEHAVCVELFSDTCVAWACMFLEALNLNQYATATAQPGLAVSNINEVLIPIPPVKEQRRIASRIQELKSLVEIYDLAYSKVETLNNEFPDLLKKSILQQAIQGKLVPQDPNDEPADALLSRIRAEKQRLIREGKIKKDKHESVIFRRDNSHYEKQGDVIRCIDDEIPFEIPSTWNWARISTIVLKDVGGGTPDKSNPDFWNGDIPWMSVKDFSSAKNGIIEDTIDHITPSGVNNSSTKVIDPDAIILCTRMGLGKTARIAKPTAINQDLRAIWLSCNISEEFFLSFYSTLSIVGSGVTVKGIKKEDLLSILIPIPPYGEQVRIIQSVNRIFEFVDAL